MNTALHWSLVIISMGPAFGQIGDADKRSDRYLTRVVRLAPNDYSCETVERICEEVLRETAGLEFVKLRISGSGGDQIPKGTHLPYSKWQEFYHQMADTALREAEMISTASGAVLRFRSAEGAISRRVLRGRDPLIMRDTGITMDILYIWIVDAPIRKGPDKGQTGACIRTSAIPTSRDGMRALAWLRSLVPLPPSAVELRPDHWFINSRYFPIVYPFAPVGTPPSEEEWRRSETVTCGEWDRMDRCVGGDSGKR